MSIINMIYIGNPATAISLDKNSIALTTVGQTEQLTATLTPYYSSSRVVWSSSDTTIATVDNTGLVTCVTPGNCTITASTVNGLMATCSVIQEVDRPDIDSFTLTTSVASGDSRLHAVGTAGDFIYIGRDTSSLKQCRATDGELSNYSSSVISSLSYQSRGLYCKSDGTKLYDSHDNGSLYEITMNTPYSLSGATVSTNSMGVNCCGVGLSSDGTKLYHGVWDSSYSKQFIEYTLSTPRDVSSRGTGTARTVSVITSSGDNSYIYQVAISPTGKKMYFSSDAGKIYQYNLSTAYDWSTATYYGVKNTGFGNRCTFQFRDGGKRIIAGNLGDKKLYQYDAS